MAEPDDATYVEVEGKTVRLTHLTKVMFPEDGITKAELLLYYRTVAPYLLPQIRGRPLTLKAFPNGIHERPYYRRRLAATAPDWLSRVELEDGFAPVVENLADLLWVVNLDSIELHPWLSRREALDKPDLLLFDLDPGPKIAFERLCKAATVLREALLTLGVECWAKTSGANGLHVLVGIEPEIDFEAAHSWAIGIDRVLAERRPDLFTMDYTRNRRTDRVLLDHKQIGFGRTTTSIFSVRPYAGAPVSAPVTWEEVEAGVEPRQFNIKNLPTRLEQMGDAAAGVLQGQRLKF